MTKKKNGLLFRMESKPVEIMYFDKFEKYKRN